MHSLEQRLVWDGKPIKVIDCELFLMLTCFSSSIQQSVSGFFVKSVISGRESMLRKEQVESALKLFDNFRLDVK